MDVPTTPTTPAREWERTGTPGLYRRNGGQYYSRFSINGKRTFRRLNTDTYQVARIRHARQTGQVEFARQTGGTIIGGLSSMGALAAALEAEVATSSCGPAAKRSYSVWIRRLREHWLTGDFDSSQVRSVTRQSITQLRQHLLHHAPLRGRRNKLGYRPAVVNQTLTALRLMLGIAVRNNVIMVNPFTQGGAIRQSVYVPADTRRPEIPENATMERIFAEMARVPFADSLDDNGVRFYSLHAANSAEHARFLAYSGLRLAEARAATWDDVRGDWLHVRGTKTATASRVVPILPPLRALLDQIRTRRISGPILGCRNSIDGLQRACGRLGLPRLRHHDLRHYFATACIEEGIDIPTVSDWLGHCDGGALLLKTYRHLRNRHSLEAAKRITFGSPLVRSMTA
jgi:integrase